MFLSDSGTDKRAGRETNWGPVCLFVCLCVCAAVNRKETARELCSSVAENRVNDVCREKDGRVIH